MKKPPDYLTDDTKWILPESEDAKNIEWQEVE